LSKLTSVLFKVLLQLNLLVRHEEQAVSSTFSRVSR